MRFGQIASIFPVIIQGTVYLKQQALEIPTAIQCWQRRKSLLDRSQLLKACQSTPVKRFAAAAVDCISNCLAALPFELEQFRWPCFS